MMRVATAVMVFAAGLVLPQAAALAACDLRVESPSQVRFVGEDGRGYDSFAASLGEVEFTVTIENRDTNNACNGLLSIQRDASARGLNGGAGADLAYRIGRPASLATIVDAESEVGRPPNAMPISVAPGATITERLAFSVPPRQIVPSGSYNETVLLRVLDASDLAVTFERSLQLTTLVQSQASVLLYDGSIASPSEADAGTRNRQLDFHNLENGEEASLTVLVQSNDNYSVRFTSANRGALAHVELGPSQTVGYSLFFAGQLISLASGEASVNARPPTGIAGVAQPLRVRIGTIGAAHAGRYEDQLTISILPD